MATRRRAMLAVMLGTALATATTAHAEVALRADDPAPKTLRDLSRYCTACWRNARLPADRWDDCTQEVLCRLIERVPVGQWSELLDGPDDTRREFLRVVDLVKKRVQRERQAEDVAEHPVADPRVPAETRRRQLRREIVSAARSVLSPRQQTIVVRTLDGHSIAEIAAELRLAPERVSDEKYKALRRLRDCLADARA